MLVRPSYQLGQPKGCGPALLASHYVRTVVCTIYIKPLSSELSNFLVASRPKITQPCPRQIMSLSWSFFHRPQNDWPRSGGPWRNVVLAAAPRTRTRVAIWSTTACALGFAVVTRRRGGLGRKEGITLRGPFNIAETIGLFLTVTSTPFHSSFPSSVPQVIDLLNPGTKRSNLNVRWDKKSRALVVDNLFSIECSELDDLVAVLEEGK